MIAYALRPGFSALQDGIEYEFDRISTDRQGVKKVCLLNREENSPSSFSEEEIHKLINSGEMEILTTGLNFTPGRIVNESVQKLTAYQNRYENRVHAYCKALETRGISKGQRQEIKAAIPKIAVELLDENPPSDSTVMRWMRKTGGNSKNYKCVTEKFISQKRAHRISPEIIAVANEILAEKYFVSKINNAPQGTYQSCLDDIQKALVERQIQGKISLSTIKKLVWSRPAYERDMIRLGSTEARLRHRHSSGGRWPTRAFERVELDHTELDLKVIDRLTGESIHRPTITVLKDYFTGYVLSFWVSFEGESINRVTKAIKFALEDKKQLQKKYGTKYEWLTTPVIWEKLVVDNALAHHSEAFLSIARSLGFSVEFSAVRMPWMKGSIENLMGQLNKALPVHGKPSKPHEVKSKQSKKLEIECVYFDDLVKFLHEWVADVYPHIKNTRKITSPFSEMEKAIKSFDDLPKIKFSPESIELRITTSKSIFRKIGAGGYQTRGLTYRSRELAELVQTIGDKNKYEIRQDINDIGEVFVCNPLTKEWIVVPEMNQIVTKGKALYIHNAERKAKNKAFEESGGVDREKEARQTHINGVTNLVNRGKKPAPKKLSAKAKQANARSKGIDQINPHGHTLNGDFIVNDVSNKVPQPAILDTKAIGTFNNTINKA
jgi:putative transposase